MTIETRPHIKDNGSKLAPSFEKYFNKDSIINTLSYIKITQFMSVAPSNYGFKSENFPAVFSLLKCNTDPVCWDQIFIFFYILQNLLEFQNFPSNFLGIINLQKKKKKETSVEIDNYLNNKN